MPVSYIVYSKEGCSQCTTAKQMLDYKGIPYVYKSIPEDLSVEDFRFVLESFEVSRRGFPQIVMINEDKLAYFVGGVPELIKSIKDNSL